MNPNETAELMDTIRFVREKFDMTILLIEHDMKLVSGICERLTVLNFGQVLCRVRPARCSTTRRLSRHILGIRRRELSWLCWKSKDLEVYYG